MGGGGAALAYTGFNVALVSRGFVLRTDTASGGSSEDVGSLDQPATRSFSIMKRNWSRLTGLRRSRNLLTPPGIQLKLRSASSRRSCSTSSTSATTATTGGPSAPGCGVNGDFDAITSAELRWLALSNEAAV